jgi:hypothetical protein
VEGVSGKNKKKYHEYNNCPGLAAKLKEIQADPRFKSEEEKQKAMEKCLSDPSNCPLGTRHPPHGKMQYIASRRRV